MPESGRIIIWVALAVLLFFFAFVSGMRDRTLREEGYSLRTIVSGALSAGLVIALLIRYAPISIG